MKKIFPAVLALLFLSALPPGVCPAQGAGYLLLKGGLFDPSANDLDNFGTDYNVEAALGGYFIPRILAVELGVGAFRTKDGDRKIHTIPVLLTAKGSIPLGNLEPFVEAGGGVYFVDTTGTGFNDDDKVAGVHVGAGANFVLAGPLFLSVEGRHLWAKPQILGQDIRIDGYTATVGLGLRF